MLFLSSLSPVSSHTNMTTIPEKTSLTLWLVAWEPHRDWNTGVSCRLDNSGIVSKSILISDSRQDSSLGDIVPPLTWPAISCSLICLVTPPFCTRPVEPFSPVILNTGGGGWLSTLKLVVSCLSPSGDTVSVEELLSDEDEDVSFPRHKELSPFFPLLIFSCWVSFNFATSLSMVCTCESFELEGGGTSNLPRNCVLYSESPSGCAWVLLSGGWCLRDGEKMRPDDVIGRSVILSLHMVEPMDTSSWAWTLNFNMMSFAYTGSTHINTHNGYIAYKDLYVTDIAWDRVFYCYIQAQARGRVAMYIA